MFKVRIIRLLTMVLAIGTLVSPSYSAQASTPLGNTFFSQTDDLLTNFYFSDITITKTIFLAQSESMTVTGLLETDPGNVRGPLVGATVTISLQKVNPANSNASVGAPITTTAITGADGRYTKSFTSPASGKYFITFGTTNATAALTVKATDKVCQLLFLTHLLSVLQQMCTFISHNQEVTPPWAMNQSPLSWGMKVN
jgi:hypothetical protein